MSTFERLCNDFGSYPEYTSRLEPKINFEVKIVDGKIYLHATNYEEAITKLNLELAAHLQETLQALIKAAASDTGKDSYDIKKILKSAAKSLDPTPQLLQISIDRKMTTPLEKMVSGYLIEENQIDIGLFMLRSFSEKAVQMGMELEDIETDTECLALAQSLKNAGAIDQSFVDKLVEFFKLKTGDSLPDISEIFTTIQNITNEEYMVLASIIGVYIHDQLEDS